MSYDPTKPADYTERPHGVDCPDCRGGGDVDLGDGPHGEPQIHPCRTCYGTGRVPERADAGPPEPAPLQRIEASEALKAALSLAPEGAEA